MIKNAIIIVIKKMQFYNNNNTKENQMKNFDVNGVAKWLGEELARTRPRLHANTREYAQWYADVSTVASIITAIGGSRQEVMVASGAHDQTKYTT
jgi:hypothetical protein